MNVSCTRSSTSAGAGALAADVDDLVQETFIREGSRPGQEAGERARMAADQFGRRRLVATVPGGDQRRIGRHRGDGLGGSHACWYGGRWGNVNIKVGGGCGGWRRT